MARTCPSCKREIAGTVAECPFCGIIFARWRPSANRPRPATIEQPVPPHATPQPAQSSLFRLLKIAILSLAGAAIVIGGYWFVKIRPRIQAIEGGYPSSPGKPSRMKSIDLDRQTGIFDRSARLPVGPTGIGWSGGEFLVANRLAPGGFLRIVLADDDEIDAQTIPVHEPAFDQQVGFNHVAWNGSEWVALAMASWFQRGNGDVFVTLEPGTLMVREIKEAPPLLGCLAWDGTGYWAATRKNTMDSGEEAFLYRLDREFRVTKRYPPLSSGCQGMAWDGALLWMVDVFSDRIYVVDTSGSEPEMIHSEETGVGYLSGIAWDGSHLWVTEYGENKLLRLDAKQRVAWSGGRGPTGTAVAAAVPSRSADPVEVQALQQKLRSDHWADRMRAEQELRTIGVPIGFDREQDSFADRGEEEMDAIDWQAEVRGDAIVASWRLWFGPRLFDTNTPSSDSSIISIPIFRRYTVSVEGGTLPAEVERVYDAIPGENVMNDVTLVSGLGPGKYTVNCFFHVQYVKSDGTNMILNESAMSLWVEK